MAGVVFNEESQARRAVPVARDPLFVRILMKLGVAKSRRGAEALLIVVVMLSILLIVLLFPKGRGAPELDVPMAGPTLGEAR